MRLGYLRVARGLLAADDAAVGAACVDLGFVDRATIPRRSSICCRSSASRSWSTGRTIRATYDIVERGMQDRADQLSHRLYQAPGHQVFLLRALVGLDGTLEALGTVRNWHRIFQEIVAGRPDDKGAA